MSLAAAFDLYALDGRALSSSPLRYPLLALAAAVLVALWMRRQRRHRAAIAEALRTGEQRLNLALVGSGDGLWDWNLVTGEIYRLRIAEMLGYHPSELPDDHSLRDQLIHPEDRDEVERRMAAAIAGRASYVAEYRMRARDGRWRWIHDQGNVVTRDDEGRPLRIAGTCRDVTERKTVEQELRLWATVFESSAEAVVVSDPRDRIVAINPAFSRMTGYAREEVLERPTSILHSQRHDPNFYRQLRQTLLDTGRWQGEVWQHRKNGDDFLAWVNVNAVRDEHDRITHYVLVAIDITQRKLDEERLRILANYDTLTELPNRSQFQERLAEALARMEAKGGELALIFADLDRFKQINDSLGHAIGDRLLQVVAQRLRGAVRRADLVARLGGDEFTVVMENAGGRERIRQVAERILGAFARPVHLEGHEIPVTTSIGISVYPRDGTTVEVLLKHADTAMYQAKSLGRNQLQFFTAEMSARAIERLSYETNLRRAEERGELELRYQPTLDLASDAVSGVEALLRWRHPERGLLAPKDFLEVAEDAGLIVPIGAWVLRTACAQAAAWQRRGLTPLEVAVNLSASQLRFENLADTVASALDRAGLAPELLLLELTESVVMEADSAAQSIARLYALKDLGVRLAIDDFGTGYSSLSYLKRLPIDTLKIDRSFVRDLLVSPQDAAIVEAIIAMARSLGLRVVAEGVETREQLDVLRRAGCHEVQGYYFSRPRPASEIPALVAGDAAGEETEPPARRTGSGG